MGRVAASSRATNRPACLIRFGEVCGVADNLAQARSLPIVISSERNRGNGVEVLAALFDLDPTDFATPDEPLFAEVTLTGGNDGLRPTATEYEGVEEPGKTGLKIFEDIEDISIVAAPGSTFGYENGYRR